MKKHFLLILLFSLSGSFSLWSQLNETFSDGDFTHNPAWGGNTNYFIVQKSTTNQHLNELRLKGVDGSSKSYLSTSSSRLNGTEWVFKIRIEHNPSQYNYAIFYLASDESDLLSSQLKGYYLRVGHRDDNLVLFKQDGSNHIPLIEGAKGRTDYSVVNLWIRVSCDLKGNWKIAYKREESESFIMESGTALSSMNFTPSHLGLVCVYTKSYNSHFYLGDIQVKAIDKEEELPDSDDTTPPSIIEIETPHDKQLDILFDEPIDVSRASFTLFNPEETPDSMVLSSDKRRISLFFSSPFVEGEERTFSMFGVRDLNGNLRLTGTYSFVYRKGGAPDPITERGEVVISEIMANPTGAVGLPEVEYVELYNRGDKDVVLSNLTFVYDTRYITLPTDTLRVGEYIVLCNAQKKNELAHIRNVVGVAPFPILANTGKLLQVVNQSDEIVSWVEYADTWYQNSTKKKGGWSLECIDLNNLSGSSDNWIASIDPMGGTPGRVNSVKKENTDSTPPSIQSFELLVNDSVHIAFSKSMNVESLSNIDNYRLTPNIDISRINIDYPQGEWIDMVFAESLPEDQTLTIEMPGLRCASGLALPEKKNKIVLQGENADNGEPTGTENQVELESDVLSVSAVGHDNVLRIN
ncbi:MAG: lamin tail domain-containing protein, partial [Bacteroidales bacterium]